MGYTGAKALQMKSAVYDAFKKMQAKLKNQADTIETLQDLYLSKNPQLLAVLEFKKLGYGKSSIANLLNISATTVQSRIKVLASIGAVEKNTQPKALAEHAKRIKALNLNFNKTV